MESVTANDLLRGGTYSASPESSVVQWYHTENITRDGTLFTLQFSVNENAGDGNYNIAVGLRDGITANLSNAASEIVLEAVGGVFLKDSSYARIAHLAVVDMLFAALFAAIHGE